MSTVQNLSLHAGESWTILFTAHESDGTTIIPLPSGSEVEFRISTIDGPVLTLSVGDGITITNEDAGEAEILVPIAQQDLIGFDPSVVYFYAIRIQYGGVTSLQAEGRFDVVHSLFMSPLNDLLLQFRTRFPEFTEDDAVVSLYLDDAERRITADGFWSSGDVPEATLFLAAHLMWMRKTAAGQYSSAGSSIAAGQVRAIRVEDRMVSFSSETSAAATRSAIAQSMYGQHYLSLMRRQTRTLLRM